MAKRPGRRGPKPKLGEFRPMQHAAPVFDVPQAAATSVAPTVAAVARPRGTAGPDDRLRRALDVATDSAASPVERISAVRQAREHLDDLELVAWRAARRQGLSWLDIGQPLGITRSAAQQRMAMLERRRGQG